MKHLQIQLLVDQINAWNVPGSPVPEDIVNQYAHIVSQECGKNENAIAAFVKALNLRDHVKLCEALATMERALLEFPSDVYLQTEWDKFARKVSTVIEGIGQRDPSAPEFLRTYEKLQELGYASINSHLPAIHAYQRAGNTRAAVELTLKLYTVAPNLPGLADAISLLAKDSEDVRLQKLAGGRSK